MNRLFLLFLSLITIGILGGCGSTATQVALESSVYSGLSLQNSIRQARALKSEVQENSTEVNTADSLLQISHQMMTKGKEAEAYWSAQAAIAWYRLSLAREELARSRQREEGLEQTLVNAREQLKTYQEVLQELEGIHDNR